jgi:hypothetical protein
MTFVQNGRFVLKIQRYHTELEEKLLQHLAFFFSIGKISDIMGTRPFDIYIILYINSHTSRVLGA